MKKILQDLSLSELKILIENMGEKPYRATQIYKGLSSDKKISELSDISKDLRLKLIEDFEDETVEIIKTQVSRLDGTTKFLFKLADGNLIEGVLMKYKYGNTQCVSTQVGCRMSCKFCASGIGGLVRNLTSGEILSEVYAVNKYLGGTADKRAVTNIVLMGSGEPLDNYENTIGFLKTVSSKEGLNISLRNISLSTCGIVPNIVRLSEEGLPVNLTISLHNPFDDERKRLMPIANKYKIEEILTACEKYFDKTGRRYIFEYCLCKGENDKKSHAEELIRLLKGRPCHVNLIRLNAVKENDLKTVDEKEAYRFAKLLEDGGLSVTVRRQMGADIDGACGQLRRKFLSEGDDV